MNDVLFVEEGLERDSALIGAEWHSEVLMGILEQEYQRKQTDLQEEPMSGSLWQDLRYGVRMLWKNPGFTLIAMLTLSLGIGANTAIFSLTNALVLRPFDFPDLDRLVMVSGTMAQQGSEVYGMTPADYADLRRQQTAFVDLAAYPQSSATLTVVGEPERVQN